MIAFFKELKNYTRSDLEKKLDPLLNDFKKDRESNLNENTFHDQENYISIACSKIINDLLEQGVLKCKSDENENVYSFQFVGLFGSDPIIGCCVPKFFDEEKMNISHFKKILEAIKKCQRNRETQYSSRYGEPIVFFHKEPVEHYFILDYIENGLYTNYKTFLEDNGIGEIDWDYTINETIPTIKGNRPYYTTLKTWAAKSDEEDYFRRLHKFIVTECFRTFKDNGLLELFDLPFDILTDETENAFGPLDYIKYRLNQEIQVQFISRKRDLLNTMYSYFERRNAKYIDSSLTVYGVNNFDLIWQDMLAFILSDKHSEIEEQIAELRSPQWFHYGKEKGSLGQNNASLLKTDIVSTLESETSRTFCILDAKNYLITWKNKLYEEIPGVQDIVKQFAYHREFLSLIAIADYDQVINALLFPKQEAFNSNSSKDRFDNFGFIEMPIMMDWGEDWLVPIHLVSLSPSVVIKSYLKNEVCDDILKKIANLNNERAKWAKKSLIRCLGSNIDEFNCMVVQDKFVFPRKKCNADKYLYFVKETESMVYPMHPNLNNCTKLIAYSAGGECFIANVNPAEKIEMDFDNIEDDVDKRVFQIKNGSIYKLRLTSWEKLDDFRRSDLNKCRSDSNWYITGNDENEFLPLNAPKVIKISLR